MYSKIYSWKQHTDGFKSRFITTITDEKQDSFVNGVLIGIGICILFYVIVSGL